MCVSVFVLVSVLVCFCVRFSVSMCVCARVCNLKRGLNLLSLSHSRCTIHCCLAKPLVSFSVEAVNSAQPLGLSLSPALTPGLPTVLFLTSPLKAP